METKPAPGVTAEIDSILRQWRARALNVILVIVVALGLPATIASLNNAFQSDRFLPLLWVYPVVYVVVVILAALYRLDVRIRGWGMLLLAYTNAIASSARLGLTGSGRLYLFWAPIMAIVLIGARSGFVATAISLLIFIIFGALGHLGILGDLLEMHENPTNLSFWLDAGVAMTMLLLPAVVLLERFHRLQVNTLMAERLASSELSQANARLEEYSRTLEEKVTERTAQLERATKEAEVARAAAEEANQYKSRFLANMSHELRTPLNAILNFTAFVADGMLGPVTEKQASALNQTAESGKHLLSLINDILDISKIESGMMTLFIQEIDLNASLASVVSIAKGLVTGKPIELITDIEQALPPTYGDRRRVHQIFLNLVSNAVKFTPSGSVTIAARNQNGRIEVSVKDTGVGIAPEEHEAIFETFQQAKHDLPGVFGTGLGLSISKYFAEMHGGEIRLESEVGKGSTFYVSLPILTQEEAERLGEKSVQG